MAHGPARARSIQHLLAVEGVLEPHHDRTRSAAAPSTAPWLPSIRIKRSPVERRSSTVPEATSRPLLMMATSLQILSTSSSWWLEK